MRPTTAVLAALALIVATPVAARHAADPKILYVKDDDRAMEAAKAKARATLPDFYAHLAHPGAGETASVVKFDVIDGPEAEFMWAVDLTRDATGLSGTLVDDAVEVAGFKAGQRVRIADGRIIDWGYRRRGVMQGNFTTRVLFAQMPPGEAAGWKRISAGNDARAMTALELHPWQFGSALPWLDLFGSRYSPLPARWRRRGGGRPSSPRRSSHSSPGSAGGRCAIC